MINLLTNEEAALQAIADMEGEDFVIYNLCYQEQSPYSIPRAIRVLAENNPGHIRSFDAVVTVSEIYGNGGFNRYFVRKNGDVLFSVPHSNRKSREKAERLGFKFI